MTAKHLCGSNLRWFNIKKPDRMERNWQKHNFGGTTVIFGWFANQRKRWAFIVVMVLYGLDSLILLRACGELQAQENEEWELSRT
ncbi:MAG: hypothetical protein QNL91_15640 [Candidatus Krumholzibacteria bacterium]|nr:hypothetical protein [Candidatus Krumholzibacteria bacterium]